MRSTLWALLAWALFLSACGGGGGDRGVPASCGMTDPCGGDVVGTWVPGGSCTNRDALQTRYMTQFGGACPSGTSVSVVDATPNWASISSTFEADGSYSGTTTFSASVEIAIPTPCLVTSTCADLDADMQAMVDPAAGIVAASCRDGGASCACTIMQQLTTVETGTYSTAGTHLMTVPARGGPTDTPYCVRGSELHLLSVDTSGAASIASDIVLLRR